MRRCEEILRNVLTKEKTSSSKKAVWNFSMANKTKSVGFLILEHYNRANNVSSFKKRQVPQEEKAHLGSMSIT